MGSRILIRTIELLTLIYNNITNVDEIFFVFACSENVFVLDFVVAVPKE